MANALLAVALMGFAVFPSAPAHQRLTIYNDTRAPVQVSMDDGETTTVAPRGSSQHDLQGYGSHRFLVRPERGEPMSAQFELGLAEGERTSRDELSYCIAVTTRNVVLMARQDCYLRVKRH